MKKVLLLFSAFTLLILSSCKKNNGGSAPEELNGCSLTSVTNTAILFGKPEAWNESFTYDRQHKISRIDYSDRNSTDLDTLIYDKNKIHVVARSYTYDPNQPYKSTYILDNKGRIVNSIDHYNKMSTVFTYNSEGFLSQKQESHFGNSSMYPAHVIQMYSYTNGNLTKIIHQHIYGTQVNPIKTINISYTNDKLKNEILFSRIFQPYLLLDRSLRNLMGFLGKGSKNLPSKIVMQMNYPNQQDTETTAYTYQKDTKGNVAGLDLVRSTLPYEVALITREHFNFSYDCN